MPYQPLRISEGTVPASCIQELTARNGKERRIQCMSEILEKILDKKNIDRAYQQICLRGRYKSRKTPDILMKTGTRFRTRFAREAMRTPDAGCIYDRQNHPAGDCTDPQPSLRSRFFRTLLRLPARQKLRDGGLRTAAAARGGVSLGGGYWLAEFL